MTKQKCKTCVFGGSPAYGDPHQHPVVKEAIAKRTYVKCHNVKTGYPVCRGWDEHYPYATPIQRLHAMEANS